MPCSTGFGRGRMAAKFPLRRKRSCELGAPARHAKHQQTGGGEQVGSGLWDRCSRAAQADLANVLSDHGLTDGRIGIRTHYQADGTDPGAQGRLNTEEVIAVAADIERLNKQRSGFGGVTVNCTDPSTFALMFSTMVANVTFASLGTKMIAVNEPSVPSTRA